MRNFIIAIIIICCVPNIIFAADTLGTKSIVAIMDFKNNGQKDFDYLQSSLSNMLATTFANSDKIQIVEREQLEKIVSEMKVGMTGLIDAKQAAQIGKVAGAKMVVIGSFTNLGSSIRIDAKVVNVETGIIVPKATASAKADKIENLDVAIDQLAGTLLTNLTGEEINKTIANDSAPSSQLDNQSIIASQSQLPQGPSLRTPEIFAELTILLSPGGYRWFSVITRKYCGTMVEFNCSSDINVYVVDEANFGLYKAEKGFQGYLAQEKVYNGKHVVRFPNPGTYYLIIRPHPS